jgi:hypothetical protein
MPGRTWEAAIKARAPSLTVAVVLAAMAALSACGSATTGPASAGPSAPAPSAPAPSRPAAAPPIIVAVSLGTTFSPDSLTLAAGQKFQVIVRTSVLPAGADFPQRCASGVAYPVAGGLLSVTCPADGGYLFTAEHPGTTTLTATVRPRCSPGEMCPQWITEAALQITIS